MNDNKRQQEHYDRAMKNLIEAEKEYRELTSQNKEKFAKQVLRMFGITNICNIKGKKNGI